MDFNLTEDRRMVLDTLSRYLKDQYPVEHRIKVAYDVDCVLFPLAIINIWDRSASVRIWLIRVVSYLQEDPVM